MSDKKKTVFEFFDEMVVHPPKIETRQGAGMSELKRYW